MRYWWVNHKQTVKQEVAGGYLWSPQTKAGGGRNQFYENMRRASPGDPVISYAHGVIKFVGVVQDFARVAPRPPEFHKLGEQWSATGWLLPVAWKPLHKAIRPKDQILALGNLLPEKYSPIERVTGNGNQAAYLAEVSPQVFAELAVAPNLDVPAESCIDPFVQVDDALQEAISTNQSLDASTKQQLILARHGQGTFRSRVISLYKACCLTGVESQGLLVASHIKPWRACVSTTERLDGANGLLLAPHADRLFDRGLLTFESDGRALVSSTMPAIELARLGLAEACSRIRAKFPDAAQPYLQFHREQVFLT